MGGFPSAIGRLADQSAVRSLDLDGVRVTYVVDGAMGLAPQGFFPDIPAGYWAAHRDTLDDQGLVAMSAGGLLIERDGRALLVDAGLGTISGPIGISEEPFGASNSGELPKTLAALGRTPEDIDAVAFTHLHADHTGWSFVADRKRRRQKFFSRAQYFVAADELAPHTRGETIPGAPPREDVIEPLLAEHTPIADGDEIFPGVRALITPGHSPGHTSYLVTAGERRLLVFGDAFHIPAQLAHPDWPSRPDVDTDAVLAARRRLLTELTRPDTLGFACHFGDQAFGRVVADDSAKPSWEPVPAVPLFPPPRELLA